jgi:hypothetical protein
MSPVTFVKESRSMVRFGQVAVMREKIIHANTCGDLVGEFKGKRPSEKP